MFSATVHQVSRRLGKDTLIPVPSLDVSDNIYPLSLVVRETRRRYWFWRKTKTYTTEFKLSHILEGDDNLKATIKKEEISGNYQSSTNFAVKGKFGIDLSKELLDADLATADSILVSSNLGDIEKAEVDLPALLKELNNRTINLNHPLVHPLIQKGQKMLCIVTGVVQVMKDAEISSTIKLDGSADMKASCFRCQAVGGELSGEIDEVKTKSLKIPKDTPLAYNIYDLLVNKENGKFEIVIDKSSKGGFTTQSFVRDEVDAMAAAFSGMDSSDSDPKVLFKGHLNLSDKKREEIRNTVKGLMELPKLIDPLNELLQQAEAFMDLNVEKTTNLDHLRKKFGSTDDDLLQFLKIAGFQIKDNGDVEYLTETSDIFESCQLLIFLLDEFDDDELSALANCVEDSDTACTLLEILEQTEHHHGNVLELSDEHQGCLSTDTGKKFVEALDMSVGESGLVLPVDNMLDVQAAFLVLFALYGQN